MSLTFHFHPLSSFCQKALIALYENDTPFTPQIVNLGEAASRAAFVKLWPIGKMPVLRDEARDRTVPEASVIVEYLALHYPGAVRLVPADPDLAWQTRLTDRFYDLYINEAVGKIVTDRLRPADRHDPQGVEQARTLLQTALGMVEQQMATRQWATGDAFTLADCAAAPALFYANLVAPFGESHKNAAAYLARLQGRPSYARAAKEAEPYLSMFPR
jgi:glutathione S-transferase